MKKMSLPLPLPSQSQSLFQSMEDSVVLSLGWPLWALRSVAVLCLLILLLFAVELILGRSDRQQKEQPTALQTSTANSFRLFQLQYLSVYLCIMLADWLQGTNMYTLYSSYGVDVGSLFLTGFLSSALFGTFLGVYVDRWGRRLGKYF